MRYVESNINIAVSPDKVILAFTDAEQLTEWWGVEKSLIELRQGGIYTLAWGLSNHGIKYVSTGIIKEYDPKSMLHVEKYIYLNFEKSFLGPQELKVKAIEYGDGSRLYLSQGPYPENSSADWDWFYIAVVEAWPNVLLSLKRFLEIKFTN